MTYARCIFASLVVVVVLALRATPGGAAPEGRADASAGTMTWAVHMTLVPSWFDPAETIQGTPFMVLLATHDALVKPMPGRNMAPSLAESWSASADGLTYEFVLRKGVKFHNGEPVTADDVKFSFERYRGIFAKTFKERVAAVEILDLDRVRFRLKQPWPDFMTFYGTRTTGAGWIVPKKYVEKVGDDGYKKAPIGAGPYRFVSFTPGVELVLEAFQGYWRKVPSVKRLVFRVIPDHATRLAAPKRGDVDIGYLISGELAGEVKRTQGLTLKAVGIGLKLRPLERATFFKGVAEKRYKNLVYLFIGASGNAATWLESLAVTGGAYAYGGYPDIDGLFREQAAELDRSKREMILHRIQQLVYERAMFAPVWDFAFLHGVGPRVEESGLGLLGAWGFSGPYEDVKLKGK